MYVVSVCLILTLAPLNPITSEAFRNPPALRVSVFQTTKGSLPLKGVAFFNIHIIRVKMDHFISPNQFNSTRIQMAEPKPAYPSYEFTSNSMWLDF